MPSTDPVGLVDPFETLGRKCENDCLALDDCIENYDETIEEGGLADVVPPFVGRDFAAATVIRGESNLRIDRTPASVGVSPADEDMSVDEHEAIVVGAIGAGAPWFWTGWAEGSEVEFMIYTGCQVTILATSVFERMCAARTRCLDPGCDHSGDGWCQRILLH